MKFIVHLKSHSLVVEHVDSLTLAVDLKEAGLDAKVEDVDQERAANCVAVTVAQIPEAFVKDSKLETPATPAVKRAAKKKRK